MIKDWFKNSRSEDTHPSEEELLRCVDGELSSRDSSRVRSHLETCWSCRLNLEKIEETISAFVEFRQQIQIPLTQAPPNNWNNFDRKLNSIAGVSPTKGASWWSQSRNKIGRYFQSAALLSKWSVSWRHTAFGAAATLVITALIWQFVVVRPISASDLLDRSLQMQAEQIGQVDQAVTYQKLRVRRNDISEISWELWRDTTRSRIRQNVTSGVNAAFDQELLNILRLNGFDAKQPLSPAAFANWRKGLAGKTDSVDKMKAGDGSEILVLRTANQLAQSPGQIGEATLTLRANDFHPIAQVLKVNSANGIQTYEFTEIDYRIVSLSSLEPDFFPPEIPLVASSSPEPALPKLIEANTNTAVANTNTAEKVIPAPFAPASVDLEVEIFSLLNKAKADLGEQIAVSREADGRLRVRGLVDTATRKNEILDALTSVRSNPAVRIEIKTVDEAVAEQKSIPKPSSTAETIESQSSVTAADSELRSYFKSEDAARQFGSQMIARSNRAMSRAYALKRLISGFTPDELHKLSPEARAKLITLVHAHAGALREECEGLSRELQPVFGSINTGAAQTPEVNDIVAFPEAVDALVTLASTNDIVVRSAFTLSSGGAGFTAIKTAQFWRSLRATESLAARLQSIK